MYTSTHTHAHTHTCLVSLHPQRYKHLYFPAHTYTTLPKTKACLRAHLTWTSKDEKHLSGPTHLYRRAHTQWLFTSVCTGQLMNWLCSSINSLVWNYVSNGEDNFGIQMWITLKSKLFMFIRLTSSCSWEQQDPDRRRIYRELTKSFNMSQFATFCSYFVVLFCLFWRRPSCKAVRAQFQLLSPHLHTTLKQ